MILTIALLIFGFMFATQVNPYINFGFGLVLGMHISWKIFTWLNEKNF